MSARNRNNFWYGLDHIYATCANTVRATARAKLVVSSFMPPMVFVRADQRHLNDRVAFWLRVTPGSWLRAFAATSHSGPFDGGLEPGPTGTASLLVEQNVYDSLHGDCLMIPKGLLLEACASSGAVHHVSQPVPVVKADPVTWRNVCHLMRATNPRVMRTHLIVPSIDRARQNSCLMTLSWRLSARTVRRRQLTAPMRFFIARLAIQASCARPPRPHGQRSSMTAASPALHTCGYVISGFDGWISTWDNIDKLVILAGLPERTTPIAAERFAERQAAKCGSWTNAESINLLPKHVFMPPPKPPKTERHHGEQRRPDGLRSNV
ncbi:hypothetical protein [Paraburkholderia jirisanensis]